MTPASVTNIEQARLRRAVASGEPSVVLEAVERVLDASPTPRGHEEAAEALAGVFWAAVEDEALSERAGTLDLRIGRGAS